MSKKIINIDGRFGPNFKVVIKRLSNYISLSSLFARGSEWSPLYRGKKLVNILDTGDDVRIKIHSDKPKYLSLTYSELAELRALIEVLNRTSDENYFDPLKISSVTERK